jgi:hypothetical protein
MTALAGGKFWCAMPIWRGFWMASPVVVALTDGQSREFLPDGGFYEVTNDTVTLMVTSLQGG